MKEVVKISALIDFFESIIGSFYQFQVKDVIDIFLVTIIIYNIIVLVQQTRAVQVSKGIVGVLIVYFFLKAMNLSTITWLLDNVLIYGTLIMVIIFQPELRNVLEKLGRSSSTSSSKTGSAYVAESLAEAMVNMSNRKVGALIVVEQITKLGDIVQTGTMLNAEVSSSILEQIFEPNTPLHDGAVVVAGRKIVAAGCLLPFRSELNIDKALGTRHRAAIGVSEVSDSLAFVVSEETGAISVAIGGVLQRNLTREDILGILIEDEDHAPYTFIEMVFGRKKRNERKQK